MGGIPIGTTKCTKYKVSYLYTPCNSIAQFLFWSETDVWMPDNLLPINGEGSYQYEIKCIATTSEILIQGLWRISLFMIGVVWWKIDFEWEWKAENREAEVLTVSRGSMQSYILTYSRFGKREPLIALGSYQEWGGWGGNFCVRGTSSDEKVVSM